MNTFKYYKLTATAKAPNFATRASRDAPLQSLGEEHVLQDIVVEVHQEIVKFVLSFSRVFPVFQFWKP